MNKAAAIAITTGLVLGGAALMPPPEANATTVASTALKIAASKKGAPYQYGGVGPSRFDCSGLVLYAFKRAGRTLPRTAQQQYNRVRHISKSSRRPGDLVFFHSGRSVYHVGIYAGGGKLWHAPNSRSRVKLAPIWDGSAWYGRV